MAEWIVSSSVLILIVLLLRFLLRGKISLRVQYALWALVLVRLLVPVSFGSSDISVLNALDAPELPTFEQTAPFLGEVQIINPSFPSGTGIPTVTFPVGEAPQLSPEVNLDPNSFDPLSLLWLLYLLGAAATATVLLVSNARFALTLRRSRKAADAIAPLPVYLSDSVDTPCLFGLLRPSIYLTEEAAASDTVQFAVTHELTHYRHGDHVWSALRGVCLALHWYNPLVWCAAFLSRGDAELACDESTIKRLGEGERAAYARTLIRLTCEKRPNVLTAATTMTGSAKGLRQRIALIVKKPHMTVLTLALVLLLSLAAVGCTFTGAGEEVSEDVTLYTYGGLSVAIPNEYAAELLVETGEELGNENTIVSVTQKASIAAAQNAGITDTDGLGWIFSIARCTRVEYERYLCADGSGLTFFATDGEWYYCYFQPTDVRFYPSSSDVSEREHWEYLNNAVAPAIRDDFITRNGLEPFDGRAFFDREFTYDSAHRYVNYYPYYSVNGSTEETYTLVLSQPVRQGEGGIWCVERMIDATYGNVYPWFPDSGMPAAEYYQQIQQEVDEGTRTDYLDIYQVCQIFLRESRYFGSDVVEGSLKELTTPETAAKSAAKSGDLAGLFSALATQYPAPAPLSIALTPAHGGAVTPAYSAWTSNNAVYCLNNLALYTYELHPAKQVTFVSGSDKSILWDDILAIPETAKITLSVEGSGETGGVTIDFYEGSGVLALHDASGTRVYIASSEYPDPSPAGDFARLLFDEAELYGVGGHYSAQNIVVEDRGQDYLAAAEEYCEEFENRRKLTSEGSRYRFTYIDCIVEEAAETTENFRERGEIGENTYAFYVTTVFVPETELALNYSMAGNTGEYTGSDPNVPDGAHEYYRCGFITLEEDGWHGNLVGTGW